jgi:RNA polymerase sigma-70 factor (ECF subfamily)
MELPITERVSDPGATSTPDERAYARIAAGDAASLRRLFSRHAPLAVAIIAHLVGRSQAQDIVQETFLLLWNRRWHTPDEDSVQTWVLGTAHSRALEMIREGEVPPRPPTAGALRTIVDAGALPRSKADAFTLARQAVVLKELMALPVDERTTIELMYFRGLSRRQIAERLDVPLSEIRRRSAAGLERLERSLRASGLLGSDAPLRLDRISRGSGRPGIRPEARSPA